MPTKRETDFLVGIKILHTRSSTKRQIKEKNTQSSAKSLSRKKHIKVSALSKKTFDRADTFCRKSVLFLDSAHKYCEHPHCARLDVLCTRGGIL